MSSQFINSGRQVLSGEVAAGPCPLSSCTHACDCGHL